VATEHSRGREAGYERFFGFGEAPFTLAPNTRFLFESGPCGAALRQVAYALARREPLVVVTGEIGSGKTLLCRTVLERVERKTFVSIVNDPQLERDELLKQMLQDFGVIAKDRMKLTPSRHDLVDALQEFLLSLASLQAHAVLVIDEAQHLQPDVLEQVRLISNMHDEGGTLLQIILAGQPDLDVLLSRPELLQLKQRVSRYVRLEPLGASEVAQYIEHRLKIARDGYRGLHSPDLQEPARTVTGPEEQDRVNGGVTFTPEAIDAVARFSKGLPRVVNLLCDRALESAYAHQVRTVDASLIQTAAGALQLAAPADLSAPGEPLEQPTHVVPATFDRPASIAAAPSSRSILIPVAAVSVAAVAVAIWFGGRAIITGPGAEPPSRTAAPPVAAPPTAPRSSVPPSANAAANPASARGSQTASPGNVASGSTPANPVRAAAEPAADGFEIVVASFRTNSRAAAVADDVTALGLPVRRRIANGWQQVLAGPFASRVKAQDAQERLDRAGLSGTQIVPVARPGEAATPQ